MVYYRKYRPQTIEELDSTKVRETLSAVLSAKEVPHAFLFTGPKGLGKTSTARIIAKVVNCTADKKDRKNGFEPCGKCDSCLSITNGSNIDVLEIDGASNRGIDEIRDLREKVKLAPSSAKKKVYIIDEVHMLTTEAFNALLKTIEEPPDHVMFMFATTEPQKVPATILSRCFHVAFPRATDEDIVHSLQRIVDGEKLKIDKEALEEIAKMADGGFRDAAKMLEEVVSVSANKIINKDSVQEHFYSSNSGALVLNLLINMKEKKIKECLTIIQKMTEQGIDMKYFLSQALGALHGILLVQSGLVEISPYKTIGFSLIEIKQLTELFSKAYQDTKFAVVPQLPLELAVVEWCSQENEKLKVKSENLEDTTNTVIPAKAEIQEDGSRIKSGMTSKGPTMQDVRKKEQNLKVRNIIEGKKDDKTKPVIAGVTQRNIQHDVNELTQLMENIIYKVKPYNHSLAGVLRGCDIAVYKDDGIVIETAYKFHQERLQEAKAKEILEQVIKEITGKTLKVMIELKG